MKKLSNLKLILIALCASINIVGSFIALNLRLPIYLDAIGTLFSTFLLGIPCGIATCVISGLAAAIAFDPVSLFFIPVQVVLVIATGIMYKSKFLQGYKFILGVAIITLFASASGSIVATYVFGGVTSSGSSYIVALLKYTKMSLFMRVFIVQYLTDFCDKLVGILISLSCLKYIPLNIKIKLK